MTFSKTVKYIHKVVSDPKKSILKFNGLSNIHIFSFAFRCLFHIILPLKRTNAFWLRQPNFQNFPGQHVPASPLRLAPLAHVWSVSSLDRNPRKKTPANWPDPGVGLQASCVGRAWGFVSFPVTPRIPTQYLNPL